MCTRLLYIFEITHIYEMRILYEMIKMYKKKLHVSFYIYNTGLKYFYYKVVALYTYNTCHILSIF